MSATNTALASQLLGLVNVYSLTPEQVETYAATILLREPTFTDSYTTADTIEKKRKWLDSTIKELVGKQDNHQ